MKKGYKWFEPMGRSINQRVKASQLQFNEAKMLYNITHDKISTWTSSRGRTLLDSISSTGQIDGLFTLTNTDNSQTLFAIASGNTYKYDNIDTFDSIDSGTFTTNRNISAVNYLEKLYMFSDFSSDPSKIYDPNTNSVDSYGSGDNIVNGKSATIAQDSIWVNLHSYPNRIYVSAFDENNQTGTDQLYNSGETLATSTRYITLDGPVTGMFSLRNYAYAFTDKSLYVFDVTQLETTYGGFQKVLNIGCTSHKSIAVNEKFSVVFWYNGTEGFYEWQGTGTALNISDMLIDKTTNQGILDQIQPTNYDEVSSETWDGKYYAYVGDLTDASNEYYQDVLLVFDIASNVWSLRNMDANHMTTWRPDREEKMLYMGAKDDQSIYKLESGLTKADASGSTSDIVSYIRTKDFTNELGQAGYRKMFQNLHLIYSGTGEIVVSYSIDGNTKYTQTGVITASEVDERAEQLIILNRDSTVGNEGFTISFEFRKTSGTMQIIAFGLEYAIYDTPGIKPVNNISS